MKSLDSQLLKPMIQVASKTINKLYYFSVSDESCIKEFNFTYMKIDDLLKFSINLKFKISKACVVHGIATWFDTVFNGSSHQLVLSTNPRNTTTHWYQVRFLLKEPMALNKNQILRGKITFTANKFQSYCIDLELKSDSLTTSSCNEYDLKNPDFRTGSFQNCS